MLISVRLGLSAAVLVTYISAAVGQEISFIPGPVAPAFFTTAVGVSSDGTVVGGTTNLSSGPTTWSEAYIWTEANGVQPLSFLAETLSPATHGYSTALFLSANGAGMTGQSSDVVGGVDRDMAFHWDAVNGMEAIGFLNDTPTGTIPYTTPLGISDDGTTVFGWSYDSDGNEYWNEAIRWTHQYGLEDLGVLGDLTYAHGYSFANASNEDGTVIVGYSSNSDGTLNWNEPFRWTPTYGMQSLGFIGTHGGLTAGIAWDVTPDGTIVVGQSTSSLSTGEAFRWIEGQGMAGLGVLGPTSLSAGESSARFVSDDGRTVVGTGSNYDGTSYFTQGFVWTEARGSMVPLEMLDPTVASLPLTYVTNPRAVSADGSTVVGSAYTNESGTGVENAAIWNTDGDVFSIAGLLADAGIDAAGWSFQRATGVSADGRVVVGNGSNTDGRYEAWIYRGGAIITPDIVAASFAELSDMAQKETAAADAAVGLELLLAGKQCGDASGWGDKRYCFFGRGTGTLGDDDAGSADVSLGVAMRLKDDFTVGISLQLGVGSSDLADGGFYEARSAGLTAFASYAPETGFQASGAIALGGSSFDVTRGYFNANTPVSSSGETEGGTVAATVKLGWRMPVTAELALTPFASYSASRFHVDGWTESGGPFPAVIAPIEQTSQVIRLGLEGQLELDPATTLWASAAIAHRFESHGAAVSGEIVGITSATTSGVSLDQDWVEAAIGADYALDTDSTLSAAVGANSLGGFSASIGYSVKF